MMAPEITREKLPRTTSISTLKSTKCLKSLKKTANYTKSKKPTFFQVLRSKRSRVDIRKAAQRKKALRSLHYSKFTLECRTDRSKQSMASLVLKQRISWCSGSKRKLG